MIQGTTVFFKTLGCKVNSFDSHALANQFVNSGYELVGSADLADITVINTCSVTENADKEARYLARRFRRENNTTFMVVTGCYAQTDSAKLNEITDIDFVVPNQVKHELLPLVESSFLAWKSNIPFAKIAADLTPVALNKQKHFKSSLTFFDEAHHQERARAFLKIQDGCNGFCSYCLIPLARGVSRSVPAEQVLGEIRRLVNIGVPEIVLTGIHIGDYGNDFASFGTQNYDLVKLLHDAEPLLEKTRIRISSLEPVEVTSGLLEIMAKNTEIYCPHFHLPMQSGSNRILKLMNRKYHRDEYFDRVRMIREKMPLCNIGADVITGFPSESDEDFADTIDLIQKCNLNYLHVFPYSKRPNTMAARLPDHVSQSVISERRKKLSELSDALKKAYAASFIGKKLEVIWEKETDPEGKPIGLTKNYLTVKVASDTKIYHHQLVTIKGFLTSNDLFGEC